MYFPLKINITFLQMAGFNKVQSTNAGILLCKMTIAYMYAVSDWGCPILVSISGSNYSFSYDVLSLYIMENS